MRVVVGGGQLR